MPFRGKIDYPARPTDQPSKIKNMNVAQTNFTVATGLFVRSEHLRISLSELQGDPLPHDAFCVNSVNERFNGSFEQIAFGGFDHGSVIPARLNVNRGLVLAWSKQ